MPSLLSRIACVVVTAIAPLVSARAAEFRLATTAACDGQLAPNGSLSGQLDSSVSIQRWCVALPSDGNLRVRATPDANLKSLCEVLYKDAPPTTTGNNCSVLPGDSILTGGPLVAGTYVVQVSTNGSHSGSGSYTLASSFSPTTFSFSNDPEPNDLLQQAVLLQLPATATGHIGYSDLHQYPSGNWFDTDDWFKFTIAQASNIGATITGGSEWSEFSVSYLCLNITDATGLALPNGWACYHGGGGGFSATVSAAQSPASGVYYAHVFVEKGAGSYKLTITSQALSSAPQANFSWSPQSPVTGQSAAFTDTSTGVPTAWAWSFGDGMSSSVQNPTHTFSAAGTYSVTLTVSNSAGSSSTTKQVTVQPAATAPIANFSFSPSSPQVGQTVSFTDTSSGTPTSWQWNFGDGNSSTLRNPAHAFAAAGSYSVKLTAGNSFGSNSSTRSVVVVQQTGCSGPNCITISGHAVVPGQVAIRGDGTFGRKVTLLDGGGSPTQYVSQLAADGSYSIQAPPATYSVYCEVSYSDRYYDVTTDPWTVITAPPRRAEYRSTRRSFTSNSIVDCSFDSPIVFLHGFLSSASKWNAWVAVLGAARPGSITFTPTYDSLDGYEKEAQTLYSEIESDFGGLFVATPQYHAIAHSKGGIVARVFKGLFTGFPLGDALSSAVLLGTPNNGSNCFSGSAAAVASLSWCYLQENINADSRYSRFNMPVFVIAGTETSPCILDGRPNDGVVPVDSVFNITHTEGGSPVSQSLPGTVVPYTHTELGGPATIWLLGSVVLPFLDHGTQAVLSMMCPTSYSTIPSGCNGVRPVSQLCIAGRGLSADGTCTVSSPDVSASSVLIRWNAPSGSQTLESPSSTTAIVSVQPACGTHVTSLSIANAATTPIGYHVYRSATAISEVRDDLRIGYTEAGETSFVDNAPLIGTSYYAVSAVYDTGESVPSMAPPVQFAGRHRSVQH